jgi:type I restriction enzyme, S subunit
MYPTAKLSEIAYLNPTLGSRLPEDDLVSFVPMASLSAETAKVEVAQERRYCEVSKGFTPFMSGDVLIAKITPCFENGKIAQALLPRSNGFGSTEFHVVRARKNISVARYLHHYLRLNEVRIEGQRRMTGSGGQRRVPANFLSELRIPLPTLEQQRHIAAILDQAETLRTQRRAALAQLDNLTQSIFLEMFGDPISNPKQWGKRPFDEVCGTRLGKMLDARQRTGQDVRRYLRNANVQWFRIDINDLLEMDFDESARRAFKLAPGDLLICEGGEPGRAAIWRGELEDVYYQKALHRGRPMLNVANAEYLVWLLWFLAKRGGLGDHVTAATIAHLTGEKLKAMPIPVPPLTLQQSFATRIQAIETLRISQRGALAELDRLFASLQQRAFAGAL